MKIESQQDFYSGIMFLIVGGGFAFGSLNYTVGSSSQMGPGYFPLVTGILLMIVGLCVAFRAISVKTPGGDPIGAIAWKPLTLVVGSSVVFGILLGGLSSIGLPPMGLIVAIYGLVVLVSAAGPGFKLKSSLLLATVLAVGSYLIFVEALNLYFQILPNFS